MSDAAAGSTDPPRIVDSVELHEDTDWHDPDRMLGTFSLVINDDRDESEDYDGVPDGAPNFEDIDDEKYWNEADVYWDADALDTRQAELDAAADAAAAAHPHRRLPIDEAISVARTFRVPVTVWIDNDPFDASDPPRDPPPGRLRAWPPEDLDLRPRWDYEPPDSSRAAAWWVSFTIDADALTPTMAREAALQLPQVLAVRRAYALPIKKRPLLRRGFKRRNWEASQDRVRVEVLAEASEHLSATSMDGLLDALTPRLPEARPSTPLRIRLRLLLMHFTPKSKRRAFGYWTTSSAGSGCSVSGVEPASTEELDAVRRNSPPRTTAT